MKRNKKSLIMLASVLVLILATVGGTLAYVAAKTTPLVNNFTYGDVPIDIPEKFDGSTKSDVKIHNQGPSDAFVRAQIIVTWKNGNNVAAKAPKLGTDYTLELNTKDWFQVGDFYYCTKRVPADEFSAVLITKATEVTDNAPKDYRLSIEILAQSVQADGMKSGKPMVEAIEWPVTANPQNEHPQTIAKVTK